MKLVIVEAEFADGSVEKATNVFDACAGKVREMPGCLQYERLQRAGRILILQKWASEDLFAAYRASEAFVELGLALKPLMTAAPTTTVATVDTA